MFSYLMTYFTSRSKTNNKDGDDSSPSYGLARIQTRIRLGLGVGVGVGRRILITAKAGLQLQSSEWLWFGLLPRRLLMVSSVFCPRPRARLLVVVSLLSSPCCRLHIINK